MNGLSSYHVSPCNPPSLEEAQNLPDNMKAPWQCDVRGGRHRGGSVLSGNPVWRSLSRLNCGQFFLMRQESIKASSSSSKVNIDHLQDR